MEPLSRPVPAGHSKVAGLLLPVIISLLGSFGGTQALLTDREASSATFRASVAGPPAAAPAAVNLYMRVGDGCVDSPLATITNPSRWPLSLSAAGTGWMSWPATVAVAPDKIGPGQSTVVSFTKWAVEGPVSIAGTVVVTASPGPFQTVIQVTGMVDNPAGAATSPYSLPVNCKSTPRPTRPQAPADGMTQMLADDGQFVPDSGVNHNMNRRNRSLFRTPAPQAPPRANRDLANQQVP